MYGENYEKYKIEKAAYDASKSAVKAPAAEEDHDPSASQLQQDIAGAETQSEDSSDVDESSSDEESPPPPPKEKTPPRSSNKRRRSDAKAAKETKEATPAKKGKSKTAEPSPVKDRLPEKRSRAKKRKSEA
jgi:hypothetical protein